MIPRPIEITNRCLKNPKISHPSNNRMTSSSMDPLSIVHFNPDCVPAVYYSLSVCKVFLFGFENVLSPCYVIMNGYGKFWVLYNVNIADTKKGCHLISKWLQECTLWYVRLKSPFHSSVLIVSELDHMITCIAISYKLFEYDW